MIWPRVLVIDEGMEMWERVEKLQGVLSPDNSNRRQTVHICADIDLTGVGPIVIGDCRRLIAPKECARSPSSRGPCVYSDEKQRSKSGGSDAGIDPHRTPSHDSCHPNCPFAATH